MLEKYIDEQEIVTKVLINSLKNNKLVQAYLFCCNDINYIFEYAKVFAKEIISESKLDASIITNICKKIDENKYNELKIIEPDGNFIKKEQLLELQNDTLNKPVEGNKIIYIIKNCEKLNDSSANSILKFLEEPEENIVAILLTDNINMVIPTIKSRCQILNFKNLVTSDNEMLKLSFNATDDEINNIIENMFNFVKSIESNKLSTFINIKKILWDVYTNIEDVLNLLNCMIYLYTDSLYCKLGKNINYLKNYQNYIDFILEKNDENNIIKKITILENMKNKLNYNVNLKIFLDELIIEMSDV